MHNIKKTQATEKELENSKKTINLYRNLSSKVSSFKKQKNYSAESDEMSKRLLLMNPDFYNVWNYRKELVEEKLSSKDSEESFRKLCRNEMEISKQCLMENPKSYPSWFHRKWILRKNILGQEDLNKELRLTTKLLNLDERNFHCWTYRRFLANKLKIPLQSEYDFTSHKIEQNFSNYSAWHYRTILINQMLSNQPFLNDDFNTKNRIDIHILRKEKAIAMSAIYTEPNDCSAWLYLLWVISNYIGASSYFDLLRKDFDLKEETGELVKIKEDISKIRDIEENSEWLVFLEIALEAIISKRNFNPFEKEKIRVFAESKHVRHLMFDFLMKFVK